MKISKMKIKKFNESNNDVEDIYKEYIKDVFMPINDMGIVYEHTDERDLSDNRIERIQFEDMFLDKWSDFLIELGECVQKLERDGHEVSDWYFNTGRLSFYIEIKKKL